MPTSLSREIIERAIAFHGHLCPGLTNGLRVAEIALRELGPRSPDEELVAVVETDNCAVDAIQFLVGTTFGKGNLLFQDRGQNVFTFARRSDGAAIRVRAKPRPPRPTDPVQEAQQARVRAGQGSPEEQAAYDRDFRERALAVLHADEAELFEVEHLEGYVIPSKAQLYASDKCSACGQLTMVPRLAVFADAKLCLACLQHEIDRCTVRRVS